MYPPLATINEPPKVCFLGPVVAVLGPRAPYCFAAPLETWHDLLVVLIAGELFLCKYKCNV